MRRLLLTLFCVSLLSTTALAQGDHNDGGAILVGYAVVTASPNFPPGFPYPTTTGGVVVFETMGFRFEVPALRAGVLPATLTTRTVLFATSGIRLSRNVGVAITNPESTDAVVTMTLRRASGEVTSSKTITIASRHQVSQFISELFADVPEVPVDFDGTLTITSDTPVAIVALRFQGANFSTIPISSLSPTRPLPVLAEGIGGRDAVLLPQFVADGGWASEIVVLNHGSLPVRVRIDLFKQDGTPLTTKLNHQSGSTFGTVVVPSGGTVVYSPRHANGDSDF